MSNLGDALRAAGLLPAPERLRQTAMAAVKENPRNWDGARDALIRGVRNDATLLWELFAPWRAQALQATLTEAATELRQQEMPRARQASGAGPSDDGGQGAPARPASRPSRDAVAAVAGTVAASLLDTFTVNGQPIGDLTPREANAWAGARERDARFVRLLTANLPDALPIRRYRTAGEAAELYALAESGNE